MLNKRGLEESHYWRGMAYEAIGDKEKAIFDYQTALQLRPTYLEAQVALARLQ
jgi:tetratricopeptide (TPR) repeat protein